MKTLIFTLLEFLQTPNLNLYVEVASLLTCLSLLPKAYVYFVLVFVFCLFEFRFFLHFGRNCKFFPKNLSKIHFTPLSISCKSIVTFHFHLSICIRASMSKYMLSHVSASFHAFHLILYPLLHVAFTCNPFPCNDILKAQATF